MRLFENGKRLISQCLSDMSVLKNELTKSALPVVVYITHPSIKCPSNAIRVVKEMYTKSVEVGCTHSKIEKLASLSANEDINSNTQLMNGETLKDTDTKWSLLQYESTDISEMSSVFGMTKLPCMFLFKFGKVIDCSLKSLGRRRWNR